MMTYTKADLAAIVMSQLENLDAVNGLARLMKTQNELIDKAHKSLEIEITKFERKQYEIIQKRKQPTP